MNNTTHNQSGGNGLKRSPEYSCWHQMKQRCLNENHPSYKNYGGRGIKIYIEWIESFESFFNYIGKKPSKKHALDRINNDGNYEPGNIKWSTQLEQNRNLQVHKRKDVGVLQRGPRWWSSISVKNKKINIGTFDTKEMAIQARKNAEKIYWNKEVINGLQ